MDNDKIERTIEFILENQAQFYADLQQIQETNKQIQEAQMESGKRLNVLERVSVSLYESVTKLTENVNELTNDVKELREGQKETDERLNVVILMVEKFLSRNNGKSE